MKSPFPGMDPFLESRWQAVHASLITYAGDALNRLLPTGVLARTGERAIVTSDEEGWREIGPDVQVFERGFAEPSVEAGDVAIAPFVCVELQQYEFQQRYLEIRDVRSGGRVITVVEFVSPTNKRPGEGLSKYRQKQEECRAARVNLVEIDLTRGGDRSKLMPIDRLTSHQRTTYQAWVSRATEPLKGWAHCLPLRQRLGAIPIPLRPTDADVLLDLQPLVDQVYETGRYSEDIDYDEPLVPPLSPEDAEWVAIVLAARSSEH